MKGEGKGSGGRPRDPEGRVRVSLTLAEGNLEGLDAQAETRDLSRSACADVAIGDWLERCGDGPRRLFQDHLRSEPFWMLVACILVNRTTWAKARDVLAEVREAWPTPHVLGGMRGGRNRMGVSDLERLLEPLGMHRARAKNIRQLARWWGNHWPLLTAEEIELLPGCGRYAADSWALFVEGRTDREPTDAKLRERWERMVGHG